MYQFLSIFLPFGCAMEVSSPSASHMVQAAKTGRIVPAPKVKVQSDITIQILLAGVCTVISVLYMHIINS